jgi:phospholipid-transporting ATPase
MEFKKFAAGGISYGTLGNQKPGRKRISNVNFEDDKFWLHQKENNPYLEKFLTNLSICHSILVDERTKKYNASSPDELALVNAAKFFGY